MSPFGSGEEHEYETERVRELVESDFEDINEAIEAARGVLKMLSSDVIDSTSVTTNGYENYSIVDVNAIGEERTVRPINTDIFIDSIEEFDQASESFTDLLDELSETRGYKSELEEEYQHFIKGNRINETLYTIAQGTGIGLDGLSSSKNKARKHAGLRFESLIEVIMDSLGVANDNHYFKIPIEDTDDSYNCEIDTIFGPNDEIETSRINLHDEEVLVSIKTTSKDRMTKVFTDKVLMSKFLDQEVPLVALFLHDVQRKGEDQINSTFVSNNFYIYHEYLTDFEGTYFIDPPEKIEEDGFKDKLDTYRELLLEDIWEYV